MKLSEYGKDMLAAFGYAYQCDEAFDLLDDYEFSPEYFKGAVVLTAEEAKDVVKNLLNYPTGDALELVDTLAKRIMKTEKNHGT